MNLVLGAGLAGLSASYHLGHDNCLILEQHDHSFGHLYSRQVNGFTWDEGPHISFTKNEYVRELFVKSVRGEFGEFPVRGTNYFRGHWIDHPAQSNLYQVPEPLRSECVASFLDIRKKKGKDFAAKNYGEWIDYAFGPRFAEIFPAAYTRKYWTMEPKQMATDWIGRRVYFPSEEDIIAGSKGALPYHTHYINVMRYPRRGGYQSFVELFAEGANIRHGHRVEKIDLAEKKVWCGNGKSFSYEKLVSTIPLPVFAARCAQATPEIKAAAQKLACSQLLLVNFEVPHSARREDNWVYVYDEDMAATRIYYTEKLAPANVPAGKSGIQAEVYFSASRPCREPHEDIAARVLGELVKMGLIDEAARASTRVTTQWLDWANVIFDLGTRASMKTIFDWLEGYGLRRTAHELDPMTNWDTAGKGGMDTIALAGRFGAWKYYWTDDCVLDGRYLAGKGAA